MFLSNTANALQEYAISGKVMSTDDNWLNDAKVVLLPVGAETRTDANVEFSLEFMLEIHRKAKQRKESNATL